MTSSMDQKKPNSRHEGKTMESREQRKPWVPSRREPVETTGHVWDGDLQEYNNPLPTWWLWGIYASIVIVIGYWLLFPAWPVGATFTKGFNSITFERDGEEVTTHWNTRSLFEQDMQTGSSAVRQREMLEQVASMDYDALLSDAEAMGFVNAYAKGSFGTWCAACHQVGGGGVVGQYPNLRDDDWLWGGSVEDIEHTLVAGRLGYMPGYRDTLNNAQLEDVSAYVLSMNGHEMDTGMVEAGERIFTGSDGGCFQCHGMDAQGLPSQGAPNLTNRIWGLVDVDGAQTDTERMTRVADYVRNGVQRLMPAFSDRLSDDEIKMLTAYVHSLGGGE